MIGLDGVFIYNGVSLDFATPRCFRLGDVY